MPAIKIEQIGGMLPAWDDHLLPPGQAAEAVNLYAFRGRMEGWRQPKFLRTLKNSATKFVYRVPTSVGQAAAAYLTFTGNPSNGDKVTLDQYTYTFVTTIGNPYDVLIGATSLASAMNFLAAITTDFGTQTNEGILYGNNTNKNGGCGITGPGTTCFQGWAPLGSGSGSAAYIPFIAAVAPVIGAQMNGTPVSVTSANLVWLSDQVSLGHTTTQYTGGVSASLNNGINATSSWLEFADPDTNVVRSQVLNDVFQRYYFASPSQRPQYNTALRIAAGQPAFKLGINPPSVAPVVQTVAGTGGGTFQLPKANQTSTTFSVNTNNTTALGNNTLHFASVPSTVQIGMYVLDKSGAGTQIAAGTYVQSFTATTVVMSTTANAQVGNGDSIQFSDVPYLGGGGSIGAAGSQVNTVVLQPFIPSGAMTLNSMSALVTTNTSGIPFSQAKTFAAVIYQDAGTGVGPNSQTYPGQLLNTGAQVSITDTGSNVFVNISSAFSTPSSLIPNTPYWIGIICQSALFLAQSSSGGFNTYWTTYGQNESAGFSAPPATAPLPTVSGVTQNAMDGCMWGVFETSAIQEARSYIYTWVSNYFEESAPSPFTLANGWSNATWQINMTPPSIKDQGTDRNLGFFRIYRTITSTTGTTTFNWVADIPITQTTFYDNFPDSQIAFNFILQSTNYFPPPPNLQGFISLPNGMIAAFTGNQIWICQPFQPHAWPPGNVFTTEFPIVGLGYTNGALVAATAANPYILSGQNPATMSISKSQPNEPCVSRGSIISSDTAVYYMSPNGLIQVTNLGQATNTSELWVTRAKWNELAPTGSGVARAVPMASCYFCYGTGLPSGGATSVFSPFGFSVELNQDNQSFTIWPQPGGHRVGFTQLSGPNNMNVDNILLDPWTGISLVLQGGNIYFYDFTDTNPVMQPYIYRSKAYQQNTKKNFSAMRAFWVPQGTSPGPNPNPNTKPTNDPSWNSISPQQPAIVQVYADYAGDGQMRLVTAREVQSSGALMRVLGGFKAENWQFRVIGQVPISNLQAATSIKELGNV